MTNKKHTPLSHFVAGIKPDGLLMGIMDKIQQPLWIRPKGADKRRVLKVYNSLTRNKDEFQPINPSRVTWYSCGPTVYDSAHIGHARNYVASDMNRRVLQDYFGYSVEYVQNVTDIDDKIIVRGREKYLFEQFSKALKDPASAKPQVKQSISDYAEKVFSKLGLSPPLESVGEFDSWAAKQDPAELIKQDEKYKMHVKAVSRALGSLDAPKQEFLEGIHDVYVKTLDKEHGATVTDHEIFRELASYYEDEFNGDMATLGVMPPTVTTRVSEYLPEIISYVEEIIKKGYAYHAQDSSVYFDVETFDKTHDYAKLQPWHRGNKKLVEEGEGSLSSGSIKKNQADFVLWKASKPGEPFWSSPWGNGRPGWHIECSVMASHVLGSQIDIHTGGIDLAFPHHDNELAQAEACFDCQQWINYFLHAGHLHVEGQKMSKSLKNFITVREALEKFSSRQLRLAFAFQQWNTPLDFKLSLSHVKAYETTLTNFFQKVKALGYEETPLTPKRVEKPELDLLDQYYAIQEEVDAAFCDSFSIPQALSSISTLVQASNEYMAASSLPKIEVLNEIARWITRIFNTLGFETEKIGWAAAAEASGVGASNKEEVALPYVKAFSQFRDQVRQLAIDAKNTELLSLCDRVRDIELFNLNVSVDDRKDQPALVKFMTNDEKEAILAEREQQAKEASAKEARKAEQKRKEQEAEAQKRAKAQIKPEEMFKNDPEYSQFDNNGLPTHDAQGEPLSKSLSKKLVKQYQAQERLYKQYNP